MPEKQLRVEIEGVSSQQINVHPEIVKWLDRYQGELINYPCHYLLIGLNRGIMCAARSREELEREILKMAESPEYNTPESLMEPTFIISTLLLDEDNWGQA